MNLLALGWGIRHVYSQGPNERTHCLIILMKCTFLRTRVIKPGDQWSRLEPSYEFHFEGLSKFSPSVEGLVQINPRHQSKTIEMKYRTHIKLVHELHDTCFE